MSPNQVKVRFELNPEDQQGYQVENLWAEPMGSKKFRLLSIPFFVFGVSAEDTVEARSEQDAYVFEKVVGRGGHSTYRIFLRGGRTINDPEFQMRWRSLAAQGCTFENANDRFISVDVPFGTDVVRVYQTLQLGGEEGIWAFEEGHYVGGAAE